MSGAERAIDIDQLEARLTAPAKCGQFDGDDCICFAREGICPHSESKRRTPPDDVLALVARIRELEAVIAQVRSNVEMWEDCRAMPDRLREALAKLETQGAD